MIIKTLEVRDEGTRIPMAAIKIEPANEAQRALLRSAGYGPDQEYVALVDLHYWEGSYDPFKQRGRTRLVAHQWVRDHFDEIKDGDVVDVQFISGVRPTPKVSEVQGVY